jgi:hypothetical protein
MRVAARPFVPQSRDLDTQETAPPREMGRFQEPVRVLRRDLGSNIQRGGCTTWPFGRAPGWGRTLPQPPTFPSRSRGRSYVPRGDVTPHACE